jgi:ATP-dependent DNA helicase RecG
VGEKTGKLFAKLGVSTIADLLRHYPRGYMSYTPCIPIEGLWERLVNAPMGSRETPGDALAQGAAGADAAGHASRQGFGPGAGSLVCGDGADAGDGGIAGSLCPDDGGVAGALRPDDGVYAVCGQVEKKPTLMTYGNLKVVSAFLWEGNRRLKLVWFNAPFMTGNVKEGVSYVFRGRVTYKNRTLSMEQPEMFAPEEYEGLLGALWPVYPLTKGLGNKAIRRAMAEALALMDGDGASGGAAAPDHLPAALRDRQGLSDYGYALRHIHFPADPRDLLAARRRLVFDEFFIFSMMVMGMKSANRDRATDFVAPPSPQVDDLVHRLPFELTRGQARAWDDISGDLGSGVAMCRLVQGDVGSGKTVLAFLAMLQVAFAGYQAALMAPTEVLARQHYTALCALLDTYGIPLAAVCLTGSMTAKEKREAYGKMVSGEAQLVVGTHALIQERAVYDNLALVITDEQHRFGVAQRERLAAKGPAPQEQVTMGTMVLEPPSAQAGRGMDSGGGSAKPARQEHASAKGPAPHVLVMSATPIPRTLAIILYGDLDISVIDELPAQRLPIKNCVIPASDRGKAYRFIQKEVGAGRQAFVICPMVEAGEATESRDLSEVQNVQDYAKALAKELPPAMKTAVLHGRMGGAMKNRIMEEFLAGQVQVLVSTTVVEVGVNVPNATVMMIENAERFGLSQLHQLRGRVGRGAHQSYCIMVNCQAGGEGRAAQRLDVLNHSNDGFFIAEEDLRLRGPGDIFGERQSGELGFILGDVYTDAGLLRAASEEAGRVWGEDPGLESPENRRLKKYMESAAQVGGL